MNGDELYELTTTYHDLGVHRTGTAPDLATCDWFFGLLESAGASLARREVIFDRYDVSASLTDDRGMTIDCDAIYYEFLGREKQVPVTVAEATQRSTGSATGLDDVLIERDQPVAVVIDGPPGQLVMPNRAVGECRRPPAVVVPSDAADRLGGALLTMEAQLVPGICEASSAVLGDGPPLVITTPLSGWWGCAGERGTGAALAIDLAVRLAETHTVTVVACSGHELDHLGLHTWLDEMREAGAVPEGPVVHLGASAASTLDGEWEPRVMLHASAAGEKIAGAVASVGIQAMQPTDPWPGEGREWRQFTPDVLSVTGSGRLFHTQADTPAASTSPAALEQVRDALWSAVGHFVAAAEPH